MFKLLCKERENTSRKGSLVESEELLEEEKEDSYEEEEEEEDEDEYDMFNTNPEKENHKIKKLEEGIFDSHEYNDSKNYLKIRINEIIGEGRYKVIKKLGEGMFASVC